MKSVLVIGMGRFGRHVAEKMMLLDNEVMIVDIQEEIIEELAPGFTDAHIGDCTSPAILKNFGVRNFDLIFVAIGSNFQSSLEITSLLKELGAPHVISKAGSTVQAKLLKKIGADEVVYPEQEIAEKVAIRHNADNIFDFIELTDEYSIFEIPILPGWVGKTISRLDLRNTCHVNILAIKQGETLDPLPTGQYVFQGEEHIVVLGRPRDVFKIASKKR